MTPPNRAEDVLRLICLGGYGEIGKNMSLLECNGQLLLIDAGIAFPDTEKLGVDLLIPNFGYLRKHAERLVGIVLTHGHEDHIGGLPFVLADMSAPLYGSALTLGLVRAKLGSNRTEGLSLNVVEAGQRVTIGCFDVEFVRINHSIPDAFALGIRTPAGLLYHSGDFKFDHTPVDGQVTDFSALARLGDEGVTVMVSDSTNIVKSGATASEAVVGRAFRRLFPRAKGRIIVATFASQIHRIQQVVDAAEALGRKVLIAGRSMERNVHVARELGYLHVPDDVRISYGELGAVPDDQLVILITGSQGEPVSGLTRMAHGSHPKLRIHDDDTVILSATPIPGNEAAIWELINDLMRRGATVITHREEDVHVSGHASAEEIKLLFNLIRPRYGVPFHGEFRHMVAYGELAQDVGLSHRDIFLLQNGDVLRVDAEGARLDGQIEHGTWTIDGKRINELGTGDQVMADRGFLGESGVITASAVWDFRLGEALAPPVVGVRGVRSGRDKSEAELLAGAVARLVERFEQLGPDARASRLEVERAAKRSLRSYFEKATGSYPVLQFLLIGLNESLDEPVDASADDLAPAGALLTVDGEVSPPLSFGADDLSRLLTAEADSERTALALGVLLEAVRPPERATHVTLTNERDNRHRSLSLAEAQAASLVYGLDDQRLPDEDGGPVRCELATGEAFPHLTRLTLTVGPGRAI